MSKQSATHNVHRSSCEEHVLRCQPEPPQISSLKEPATTEAERKREEWARQHPDVIDAARLLEEFGGRPLALLKEGNAGENVLDDYARKHGLTLPLDFSKIDLAELLKEFPWAYVALPVREEMHRLLGEALADEGRSPIFRAVIRDNREPDLLIDEDLAGYKFKENIVLGRVVRKLDPGEGSITPAEEARRKLQAIGRAIGLSGRVVPLKVDELEIRREFAWFVRKLRAHLRKTLGSLQKADESIVRDFRWFQSRKPKPGEIPTNGVEALRRFIRRTR